MSCRGSQVLLLATALLATGLVAAGAPLAAADRAGVVGLLPAELGLISIAELGAERLAHLEADPELDWWVEIDRTLVVAAAPAVLDRLGRELELTRRPLLPGGGPLIFVRYADPDDRLLPIAAGGRWTLAQLRDGGATPILEPLPGAAPCASFADDGSFGPRWFRFAPDVVLARAGANVATGRGLDAPAADPTLVDMVDVDRWFAALTEMTQWSRWTEGPDILLARDWLVARFGELPRMSVVTESFYVPGATGWNVLATLPGWSGSDRLVIVGAHYDSRGPNYPDLAPGAEDNASGCAGVLELARVFAWRRPLGTVVFVCYAGEEQGLWGSEFHAQRLVDLGLDDNVDAMLNLDMITYTSDADLDVLLETLPTYQSLLDIAIAAAAAHTTLNPVVDYGNCWCSDHAPFLDQGMPALMSIENDYWTYPYYHTSLDLPQWLTPAMGENVLRMNVAVVAEVAGMPVFTDDFEIGDARFWSFAVP